MTAVGNPPITEKGTAGDSRGLSSFNGKPFGWSTLLRDTMEHVEELQWKPGGKGAVEVYHRMRSDAQVQGLYLGSTLPIRRYGYFVDPNGARPAMVEKISRDYNLPIRGKETGPRLRTKNRFDFYNHLRHALLAMLYGHMYFEQSGEIAPDLLWHMRKLGVRMPNTIQDVRIAKDGGLQSIIQYVPGKTGSVTGLMGITAAGNVMIPVNRLVGYIWEQEGGDWTGRSMLRGIYRNWLLKDRILRVGAINIERGGGVPYIKAPRDATPDDMTDLANMAVQFRVGENSGGAIPYGSELELAKAAGGDEAIQYIKLMNEEMGRGWLMMFMNLGQTTSGSRALGGTFVDYALNAQETIADWVCQTFNRYVIEDDCEWNFALEEDEPVPLLGYIRNDDRQLAIADLVEMIDRNLIQVDNDLEDWIREEYRMPRRTDGPKRALPSSQATTTKPGVQAAAGGSPPRSSRRRSRDEQEEALF